MNENNLISSKIKYLVTFVTVDIITLHTIKDHIVPKFTKI
jgi:hypothetical protein